MKTLLGKLKLNICTYINKKNTPTGDENPIVNIRIK